jgi:hypothetical protein
MAFPTQPVRTPLEIGNLEVRLMSPDPASEGSASASFRVEVKYSSGPPDIVAGNLVPHLTQTQINNLLAFMASLRTQAEDQILP